MVSPLTLKTGPRFTCGCWKLTMAGVPLIVIVWLATVVSASAVYEP